ncbi:thioesterase II family protein [Streptomyces sp. NBC_00576]|uniref:thioesterase II family protein n=1 Tax=Streptomyces sp. NBC_00576 TaxID=2903665 RepID=UPI002E824953|nr:alpha/beta fold hydrolase [Streptomyces sp. NBC_00576]WUB70477.1 alpha/beta fold hydrolase [Streptomyces sp. NBC_00576]
MDGQWFRRFGDPEPGAFRLICFPHAGGAASAYLPLSRLLAPHIDVWAVQYPGRQDRRRETPVTDIGELAAVIAGKLESDDQDQPCAFFGHSMGALIAYETARILQERGARPPRRLFLSARGAPGPKRNPHDAPPDDDAILTAVRRLGGTGAALLDDPELVAMVLPALRADYTALAGYSWVPGEPLHTPVTVLCGTDDPVVSVEEAAGWRTHTLADTEVRVLPGGHFYLDQRLGDVAEVILRGVSSANAARAGNGACHD